VPAAQITFAPSQLNASVRRLTRITMRIEIREETTGALAEYGSVPIAFEVREHLAATALASGLGGLQLATEPVADPYVKDYDALPGEGPATWPTRFAGAQWAILTGFVL